MSENDTWQVGQWILTREHAASSYGQPVLVEDGAGIAYGPGDFLDMGGGVLVFAEEFARAHFSPLCGFDEAKRSLVRDFRSMPF